MKKSSFGFVGMVERIAASCAHLQVPSVAHSFRPSAPAQGVGAVSKSAGEAHAVLAGVVSIVGAVRMMLSVFSRRPLTDGVGRAVVQGSPVAETINSVVKFWIFAALFSVFCWGVPLNADAQGIKFAKNACKALSKEYWKQGLGNSLYREGIIVSGSLEQNMRFAQIESMKAAREASRVALKNQEMARGRWKVATPVSPLSDMLANASSSALLGYARSAEAKRLRAARMEERFLSYVAIESQSVDDPDPESFPMTAGQRQIAAHIYNEILAMGGKGVKVTLSDDQYVYVDIPANVKDSVPSILFMAHMDVTPEAPGKGIRPQVHKNYDGGAIALGNGLTLSPEQPQGKGLERLKGKTIITSDGTTLLGADDKAGCTVLVTLIEELITDSKTKHGRVMVVFSQNEDVGKAAMRYDPEVFGTKPDIVIDVDGDDRQTFSASNFTAVGQTVRFKGNMAHPSHGKENKYADALTASSYFIGCLPPSVHPSASSGKEGYIHCYSCEHPKDSTGNEVRDEYIAKIRIRYFDKSEGAMLNKYLDEAFEKTHKAFPFVEVSRTEPVLQYENVAYSMPGFVPILVKYAASKEKSIPMSEVSERGGTTSAMLSARMPDKVPGGPCIFSGQHNAHSVYEWCCVEEMEEMVRIVKSIASELVKKDYEVLYKHVRNIKAKPSSR